jgi:hypothetical protein
MGARKLTTEQFVALNWKPWEESEDGGWSFDQMKAAAAMHTAKQIGVAIDRLTRSMLALEGIKSSLDMLGREGIHDLVKEMARAARAKKRRRLAARRRRRALKVAA